MMTQEQLVQVEREMTRLSVGQADEAAAIFAAGALLALDWLKNGGISPMDYLSSRCVGRPWVN